MNASRNEIVGVVGAGLMGRGIAQIAAQAGHDVRLVDAKPGAAAEAKHALADMLATLVAKGRMTAANADAAVARIALPDELGGLAGATIVVEAIVEKLDAKQALFSLLEPIVGEHCIIATNTSSLSVTAIAAACKRPQRVAGLHFFSPVPLMKLVEVIDGLLTAPAVVERLFEFGAGLGHTPIRAKDTPGFIVNHAGRGYGTEALRIASEGIADYAAIDRILKLEAGFRMGPFELFDLTGLDVSHPVMESIYHQFYEEPRFRPSPATAQRLAAGVLGRKSGRGFYDYGAATAATVTPPYVGAAAAQRVWVGHGEPQARAAVVELIGSLGRGRRHGSGAGRRCAVRRDATGPRCDDCGTGPEARSGTHDRARHAVRARPSSHADDHASHRSCVPRFSACVVCGGWNGGRRDPRQPGLRRRSAFSRTSSTSLPTSRSSGSPVPTTSTSASDSVLAIRRVRSRGATPSGPSVSLLSCRNCTRRMATPATAQAHGCRGGRVSGYRCSPRIRDKRSCTAPQGE